jgi:hypothetical protein
MQNSPVSRQDYYICLKFLQGRKEEKSYHPSWKATEKTANAIAEFYKLHETYPGNTKNNW